MPVTSNFSISLTVFHSVKGKNHSSVCRTCNLLPAHGFSLVEFKISPFGKEFNLIKLLIRGALIKS